jgi:hypothetical protein
MHNIHYLRIKTDTPNKAYAEAEDFLNNWGNENNYYYIAGCVDQNNKIHEYDSGSRFEPSNLTEIKEILSETIKSPAFQNLEIKFINDPESLGKFDYYMLSKQIEWRFETYDFKEKEIDIFEDTLYSCSINEIGLTELYGTGEGKNTYFLTVDMHD